MAAGMRGKKRERADVEDKGEGKNVWWKCTMMIVYL